MGTKQISISERMIWSILIIHGSSICEFICSLKFNCNSICHAFDLGMDALSNKNVTHRMHVFPLRLKEANLLSCFSSQPQQASFQLSNQHHVFGIFVLFVGDLPFKVAHKCSAEVLWSVPLSKKAGMCPIEKISLDKCQISFIQS